MEFVSTVNITPAITQPEEFEFFGKHLLINYLDCSLERLRDVEGIIVCMREAAVTSGAAVLGVQHHIFPNGGMTATLMLAESHASIHTYPEHQACFADIFTCGRSCKPELFHEVLATYLCANKTNQLLVERSKNSYQTAKTLGSP
ncbi:MAG: adenosylmethionine decarboxylase [Candidatus Obscuribacterales bacterium]|nr:adenosylmethionine decarboxylase [Candidatus Obscuribacterales bacterium]